MRHVPVAEPTSALGHESSSAQRRQIAYQVFSVTRRQGRQARGRDVPGQHPAQLGRAAAAAFAVQRGTRRAHGDAGDGMAGGAALKLKDGEPGTWIAAGMMVQGRRATARQPVPG